MSRSILAIGLAGLVLTEQRRAVTTSPRRTRRPAASGSTTSTEAPSGQEDPRRPRHGHRRSERPLLQRPGQQGLNDAKSQLGAEGPRHHVGSELRLRAEPLDARAAEVRPHDRVGFLMAEAVNTVAKKFPDTKFAVIDVSQASLKGKPTNVEGLLFAESRRATSSATSRATTPRRTTSTRSPASVGGQKVPAGRPLHRRLRRRRQGGEPGDQDAERLLAGLRRSGEVQGDGPRSDRARVRRRLRRRRPVRPRRDRRRRRSAKQGIGVDADQAYLGAQIMTSAAKRSTSRCSTRSSRSRTGRSRPARISSSS